MVRLYLDDLTEKWGTVNSLVPPHWVGCLRRFGLKTGIDFAHVGLESGMVLKGTTGV